MKTLGLGMSFALAMITCSSPATAATNYAAPLPVQFTGEGYDSGDPWANSNSTVEFSMDKGGTVSVSADTTISYTVYVPKTVLQDGTAVAVCGFTDISDNEGNYLGFVDGQPYEIVMNGTDIAKTYWDEANQIDINASNITVKKTGDYYSIIVKDAPLADEYNNNGNFIAIPADSVHMTASVRVVGINKKINATLYVDDVTVGSVSEDFSSFTGYMAYRIKEGTPVEEKVQAFSNSLLKLSKSKATVKKGKTVKIKATVSPSTKITYKSKNKKIATVTSKGVVKGKKKGKTVITVSANGVSKKFTVTVK